MNGDIEVAQPLSGVIKRLTDKGFGFITQEGEEKDLFFHSSALVGITFDELREGDKVTFDVEDSDKGPRAANVELAQDAA
jgi:CspA family cold shock protein